MEYFFNLFYSDSYLIVFLIVLFLRKKIGNGEKDSRRLGEFQGMKLLFRGMKLEFHALKLPEIMGAWLFLPRKMCLFPGGPGKRSMRNPADCMARRTSPLAQ